MSDFWTEYNRRRAMNHVALMLAARAASQAAERGEVPDAGLRKRMADALRDYDDVARMLRDRMKEAA